MAKIKIQDDSGDREFFTIIPNYILNHSSSTDQSLYLQMKRYAGEDGKCFATQETLMKKLGIGIKAYRKSLDYLIKKGWIEFVGLTGGKTRPIKTYKVNNIWQENSDYYKKISAERTLSKDTYQKERDTSQKNSKIPAESTVEEEPVLRRTIKKNHIAETSSAQAFSLKEGIQTLEDSPRRDLNIIALYFEEKQPDLKSSAQFQVAVKRHLRPAKSLSVFTDNQILDAVPKAKRITEDWTCETLLKVLTK